MTLAAGKWEEPGPCCWTDLGWGTGFPVTIGVVLGETPELRKLPFCFCREGLRCLTQPGGL